jgi:hypothetical protein
VALKKDTSRDYDRELIFFGLFQKFAEFYHDFGPENFFLKTTYIGVILFGQSFYYLPTKMLKIKQFTLKEGGRLSGISSTHVNSCNSDGFSDKSQNIILGFDENIASFARETDVPPSTR